MPTLPAVEQPELVVFSRTQAADKIQKVLEGAGYTDLESSTVTDTPDPAQKTEQPAKDAAPPAEVAADVEEPAAEEVDTQEIEEEDEEDEQPATAAKPAAAKPAAKEEPKQGTESETSQQQQPPHRQSTAQRTKARLNRLEVELRQQKERNDELERKLAAGVTATPAATATTTTAPATTPAPAPAAVTAPKPVDDPEPQEPEEPLIGDFDDHEAFQAAHAKFRKEQKDFVKRYSSWAVREERRATEAARIQEETRKQTEARQVSDEAARTEAQSYQTEVKKVWDAQISEARGLYEDFDDVLGAASAPQLSQPLLDAMRFSGRAGEVLYFLAQPGNAAQLNKLARDTTPKSMQQGDIMNALFTSRDAVNRIISQLPPKEQDLGDDEGSEPAPAPVQAKPSASAPKPKVEAAPKGTAPATTPAQPPRAQGSEQPQRQQPAAQASAPQVKPKPTPIKPVGSQQRSSRGEKRLEQMTPEEIKALDPEEFRRLRGFTGTTY